MGHRGIVGGETGYKCSLAEQAEIEYPAALSSFIQYNSTGEIEVLNARFRYNPRDGNNFYIVFNVMLLL